MLFVPVEVEMCDSSSMIKVNKKPDGQQSFIIPGQTTTIHQKSFEQETVSVIDIKTPAANKKQTEIFTGL